MVFKIEVVLQIFSDSFMQHNPRAQFDRLTCHHFPEPITPIKKLRKSHKAKQKLAEKKKKNALYTAKENYGKNYVMIVNAAPIIQVCELFHVL